MTSHEVLPEIVAPQWLIEDVAALCEDGDALERTESMCRDRVPFPFVRHEGWPALRAAALSVWRDHDYWILRGLPAAGEGTSLLCAAALVGSGLRTYRSGQIVKRFQASPWTTALSHTLREGHFHTDLNTSPTPPRATVMQCLVPDPAAPEHGHLRVARLADLIKQLQADGCDEVLAFLYEADVTMVNDTSPQAWTGRIVEDGTIRFHPETIRAAERRAGRDGSRYDVALEAVKRAALKVSTPIDLKSGDLLAVSNVRALHYRSACTVRFRQFPCDFSAREVYVAHLIEEPS